MDTKNIWIYFKKNFYSKLFSNFYIINLKLIFLYKFYSKNSIFIILKLIYWKFILLFFNIFYKIIFFYGICILLLFVAKNIIIIIKKILDISDKKYNNAKRRKKIDYSTKFFS